MRTGPFNQILEVLLRILERRAVSFFPFATNVEIGIESLLKRQHLNLKLFFDQQAQSSLGCLGACRIRIEVHYGILTEASEQLSLQFGKRGARTGNHVMKSGGIDGNAIHLALDKDRVIEFLDP